MECKQLVQFTYILGEEMSHILQEQRPQRRPSHERERDQRRGRDHRGERERDRSKDNRWDNSSRQQRQRPPPPPPEKEEERENVLQWANPANPNAAAAGPRGPPQPPRIGQETGWRQTSAFGAMNRQQPGRSVSSVKL